MTRKTDGSKSSLEAKSKTGRPAPFGRKAHVGLKLTPDAKLFCQQHPDGYVHLENLLRRSKAFRAWMSQKAKLRQ